MSGDERDRALLLATLAARLGFVDADRLDAAIEECSRDRSRPLAAILEARGDLGAEESALLMRLAVVHARRHGGDAARARTALEASIPTPDPGPGARPARRLAVTPVDDEAVDARPASEVWGSEARFALLEPLDPSPRVQAWSARDLATGREVVLETVPDGSADDPVARDRFRRGAELRAGLEHPGILAILAVGDDPRGRPFAVTPRVRGQTLRAAVDAFHRQAPGLDRRARALALRHLLRRFVDLCGAVAHAHARGVLHRDLNPNAVVLGPHGETRIVDWRHAARIGTAAGDGDGGEGTRMVGTAGFLSPELARSEGGPIGPAADVHALGGILFYLLVGRAPRGSSSPEAILALAARGAPASPRSARRDVPRALDAIVRKATATQPEDRHASALTLAGDVERWLADEPVSAADDPPLSAAARWARRRPATTALAASLAAVAMVASWAAIVVERTRRSVDDARAAAFAQVQAARDESADARSRAVASLERELAARDEVQLALEQARLTRESLRITREALDRSLDRIERDARLLEHPATRELRRQLLLDGRRVYQALIGRWRDVPGARRELWATVRQLVRVDFAADPSTALASADAAAQLVAEISGEGADLAPDLYDAADTLRLLGDLQARHGAVDAAERSYIRSAEFCERLLERAPGEADALWLWHADEAELSGILLGRGRLEEALARAVRIARADERARQLEPRDVEPRALAAMAWTAAADLEVHLGRPEDAEPHYHRAVELARDEPTLAGDVDDRSQLTHAAAVAALGLARLRFEVGEADEALELANEAIAAIVRSAELDPGAPGRAPVLVESLALRAELRWERDDLPGALDDLDAALDRTTPARAPSLRAFRDLLELDLSFPTDPFEPPDPGPR